MRDLVKSLFGKWQGKADEPALQKPDSETELQIATCALLLEMAHADSAFSEEEERRIEQLMRERFDIAQDAVSEIKQLSQQRRSDSIDVWQFASTIKQHMPADKKLHIVEMIWQVIYADGTLDQHEDYLIHQLARLLAIPHEQLIEAKVAVLKKLRK
jgi:uncharacterized tellurite resistance protein B-like protein